MGNATSDDHIELFGQLFATLAQGLMQNLSIEEIGLTPQQIMTLIMVYSHPGITMSNLAELMGTTAPQLTRTIAENVSIPVIASGGAGTKEHFYDALTEGKADAVLAASLFHYKELEIGELKEYLRGRGVSVRL